MNVKACPGLSKHVIPQNTEDTTEYPGVADIDGGPHYHVNPASGQAMVYLIGLTKLQGILSQDTK